MSNETEAMRIFGQWQRLNQKLDHLAPDMPVEAEEIFFARLDAVAERLFATPSENPADFAVKMVVATNRGESPVDWSTHPVWSEARELIADSMYSK